MILAALVLGQPQSSRPRVPESYPLARSTADFAERPPLDPQQSWIMLLGRGGNPIGFDTIRLQHDGKVVLHRIVTEKKRDAKTKRDVFALTCETAETELPKKAVAEIVDSLSDNGVLKLKARYEANVADGNQWILRITYGENEKRVFCSNHFPKELLRFAEKLDKVLAENGADKLQWKKVPDGQSYKHQEDLW